MIEQKTIDEILQHWDHIPPEVLRAKLDDPDAPLVQLDTRNPEQKGYSGPRERLATSQPIPIYREGMGMMDVLQKIENMGNKNIVIAYPTSHKHLEIVRNGQDVNAHELNYYIGELYPRLIEKLEQKGMNVTFLPLVKLTQRRVVDDHNPVKPVRFWTSRKPPENATYLLVDISIETGVTTFAMRSHLKHHGIAEAQIAGTLLNNELYADNIIDQTDGQREFIKTIREQHPAMAARADSRWTSPTPHPP